CPAVPSAGADTLLTLDPSYHDKVARTIYVGGVDTKVSEQDLLSLFSQCGRVSKLCLAGDTLHAARFAFVEFESVESAQLAVGLNGTIVGDRPIRVNPSKT